MTDEQCGVEDVLLQNYVHSVHWEGQISKEEDVPLMVSSEYRGRNRITAKRIGMR